MSRLQGNERHVNTDTMGDRRALLPDTSSSSRRGASLPHQDFRTPYIQPYQGSERQYLGKTIPHSPVLGSIVMKRHNPDVAKNHGWQPMTAEQAKTLHRAATRTNQEIATKLRQMHTTNHASTKKYVKSFMKSHEDIVAGIAKKNRDIASRAAIGRMESDAGFLSPMSLDTLRLSTPNLDKQQPDGLAPSTTDPYSGEQRSGPYETRIPFITPVASFTGADEDDSGSSADKKLQNSQDILSLPVPLSPASPIDNINTGSMHRRPQTVHEGAFQRVDRNPPLRKHRTDKLLRSSTFNGQIGMPSYLGRSIDSSLSGYKDSELDQPGYYEAPRPGSPSRKSLERKLPQSITLANANPSKVETINPIGIHRRRLKAQGVPVPQFSLTQTTPGLTIGTLSTADMAETELGPRPQQPQRYESFVYRWQQQPIQRPTGRNSKPESPRSKKHQRPLAAEVSYDRQLALALADVQQGSGIVPLPNKMAGTGNSDPPPLLLTDGAVDDDSTWPIDLFEEEI